MMCPFRRLAIVMVGTALALALAVPLHAQGKGNGNGNGNGHKSSPPSSSPLPSPASGPSAAASPLAWLDDASLLAPGTMSVTVSTMRWMGTDLAEVNFPIVDVAVGLAPRVQLGASVPHVIGGADGSGPIGGMGTSYISGKIAVLTGGSGVKVAVSPMIEILGAGAAQALGPDDGRTQFGLPVSLEVSQGPARIFAATGVFSRGVWFGGGGVGFQASPSIGMSVSFTRSWAGDSLSGVARDRRELSGGVSYFVRPQIGVYGGLGRTIATTDENGAGTTVSGGVTFVLDRGLSR